MGRASSPHTHTCTHTGTIICSPPRPRPPWSVFPAKSSNLLPRRYKQDTGGSGTKRGRGRTWLSHCLACRISLNPQLVIWHFSNIHSAWRPNSRASVVEISRKATSCLLAGYWSHDLLVQWSGRVDRRV